MVEARNELGETALITAAKNGEVGKVKKLLDADADIEATDKWGRTALMWCAREGWIESLRLLVERGAALDTTDKYGTSAFRWAAQTKNDSCAQHLVSKGATFMEDAQIGGGAAHPACAAHAPHPGRGVPPPPPPAEIDGQLLTIDRIDPKIQIEKAFEHMDNK